MCCGRAVEVPLKFHWSAVEVQTANSNSHRPSPTIHSRLVQNRRQKKTEPYFFYCIITGQLGINSLTRGLHNTWKWVFRNVTIHTHGPPSSMTDPAQRAESVKIIRRALTIPSVTPYEGNLPGIPTQTEPYKRDGLNESQFTRGDFCTGCQSNGLI